MTTVTDLIAAALPQARWFAAKGRSATVRALTPLPWIGTPEVPAFRFEIAEVVSTPGHEPAYYLLPLCYRAATDPAGVGLGVAEHPELGLVSVHDAAGDPVAGDLILGFLATDRQLDADGARIRSQVVDGHALRVGLASRPFGGEQSNTSVLFGDSVLVKFFRRLEFGRNLDIEVHRVLADSRAADRVARLFGWLDASWIDSSGRMCGADLAMVVEQLPQAVDGWSLALRRLRAEEHFDVEAAELGRALRAVHDGLAGAFGTQGAPGSEAARAMRMRLAEAIAEVTQMAPLHGALDSRLARLDDLSQQVQRIHGDFHLGQVLLAAAGPEKWTWRIIDFEGEPLKSLDERRESDTVWRDVAGMLRSLDYAGAYAARELGVDPTWASAWVMRSSQGFLDGYAGRALSVTEQETLRAYQIDKAAYECRYEAGNRPEWLPIPLGALAGLADDRPGLNGRTTELT